jgi:hypothetical protein
VAQYDAVIPPGQEGKITLEVDGAKVSGSFAKNASVISNDPLHPQLTISVAGKVVPFVNVEPSTRVYLRGMYGEHVESDVTISSVEKDKDFKVLGVESNIDDKITYKVIPAAEPGRFTIRLFKNPNLPTMNTWGSLTVKTNSEHAPDKVIQVNVTTRGAIVVQPSTINFGTVAGNEAAKTLEQEVTVFKIKGEFRIKNVEFSSDFYHADVKPIEDGKKYTIKVDFRPTAKRPSYVDEMIINTDDPQEPSIRIRLLARGV